MMFLIVCCCINLCPAATGAGLFLFRPASSSLAAEIRPLLMARRMVEVHRVYPPVAADGANAVAVPGDATGDSPTDILVSELRDTIACMRREHERAIGDLQHDRNEWREQAKRLALSAPRHEPARPWWRRLVNG